MPAQKPIGSFNASTQCDTSYFLEDLHPYQVAANASSFEINEKEVTLAFEARGVPKLVDLLQIEGLSSARRLQALSYLKSVISCQEEKCYAIQLGAVEACLSLLDGDDMEVSAEAAVVLYSLFDVIQAAVQVLRNKKQLFHQKPTIPIQLHGTLLYMIFRNIPPMEVDNSSL